jgi:Zn-dependent M16 (insulinase) family peptidase
MDALKRENFYKLGEWESSSKTVPWKKIDHIPKTESQIRLFPSPVAFTVLGFRTSAYRDPDVAELMLSTQLLDHVVLHKEVREKGGAYGSSASYAPTTGNYHLYSYRDPQLGKTLDIFSKAIDQIGAGQFSERDLEEAKISLIASMDIPVAPGARAIVAYAWRRCGRIYEARQKLRNEILSATKEQVAATVLQKIRPLAGTVVSFMGEDLAKKEHNTGLPVKELFAAEFWV